MPKHIIILQFCIEIDIPFTRILFNTNSTLYYSFSHQTTFEVLLHHWLWHTPEQKKTIFFRSATVRLTAYSSQNYSINMNKPYYILLFLSFPGSAVHLHTAYCVLYFKLTQRHKVIKPFFMRKILCSIHHINKTPLLQLRTAYVYDCCWCSDHSRHVFSN